MLRIGKKGKITPKNPTTIAIIKYMLQGYNAHEISRLHLVDEDGNNLVLNNPAQKYLI